MMLDQRWSRPIKVDQDRSKQITPLNVHLNKNFNEPYLFLTKSHPIHLYPCHTDLIRTDHLCVMMLNQRGSRQIKGDQTWSDLIKTDQRGSNLIRTDQGRSKGIKPDQTWSRQIKGDQIWLDLIMADQRGSNLIRPDQGRSKGIKPD